MTIQKITADRFWLETWPESFGPEDLQDALLEIKTENKEILTLKEMHQPSGRLCWIVETKAA